MRSHRDGDAIPGTMETARALYCPAWHGKAAMTCVTAARVWPYIERSRDNGPEDKPRWPSADVLRR